MNRHLFFFRQFLRSPQTLGAVAPSSRRLARVMVGGLPLGTAEAVVEFGPGLGAVTGEILRRKGEGTRFFAIE